MINFSEAATPESLLRWALVAEELGYDSLMLPDHVAVTPTIDQRSPEPFYDTFTTLAWLAGQTKRVRLGNTVVVLPYRHPILMARMVANIDQLSGGRFILGVGIGNAEDEFAALGAPHKRRGRLANESIEAMKALWRGEGMVDYHGSMVDFTQVSAMATKQKPHPPIWVGGNTPAGVQRAAKYGDGWHPILWRNMTIEAAKDSLLDLQRLSAAAGRATPAFCPRIRLEIRDEAIKGTREVGVGSLEQIRGDVQALAALGAQHLTVDCYVAGVEPSKQHSRGLRQLAVMADEVFDLENETLR
jgi:probable F420-dependent oxidoreductase